MVMVDLETASFLQVEDIRTDETFEGLLFEQASQVFRAKAIVCVQPLRLHPFGILLIPFSSMLAHAVATVRMERTLFRPLCEVGFGFELLAPGAFLHAYILAQSV